MWLLTMVVDMFSRRPAAEKPAVSTTRTNAVSPVSRSTGISDYPVLVDNHFLSWRIIQGATEVHLPRHRDGGGSVIERPLLKAQEIDR
jgi:hypothetical protein